MTLNDRLTAIATSAPSLNSATVVVFGASRRFRRLFAENGDCRRKRRL